MVDPMIPKTWTQRKGFDYDQNSGTLTILFFNDEVTELFLKGCKEVKSLDLITNPVSLLEQFTLERSTYDQAYNRMLGYDPADRQTLVWRYILSLSECTKVIADYIEGSKSHPYTAIQYLEKHAVSPKVIETLYPPVSNPVSPIVINNKISIPSAPLAEEKPNPKEKVKHCLVTVDGQELSNLTFGWKLDTPLGIIFSFSRQKVTTNPKELESIPLNANEWAISVRYATTMLALSKLIPKLRKDCGCDESLTTILKTELKYVKSAMDLDDVGKINSQTSWKTYRDVIKLMIAILNSDLDLKLLKHLEKKGRIKILNAFNVDIPTKDHANNLYNQFLAMGSHRYKSSLDRRQVLASTTSPEARRKSDKNPLTLKNRLSNPFGSTLD